MQTSFCWISLLVLLFLQHIVLLNLLIRLSEGFYQCALTARLFSWCAESCQEAAAVYLAAPILQ